jgi:two-component sensor histidine kinase
VLVIAAGALAYLDRYPLREVLWTGGGIALAAAALWFSPRPELLYYFFALLQFAILLGVFSRVFFNFRAFVAVGGRSYYWVAGVLGIGALHALAYTAFYSAYPEVPLPFALSLLLSVMVIIFFVHLEHTLSAKEKDSLLAEVHHRVRNNLQLIESLLHLEGEYRSPEEYETLLRDLYQKIRSISLIHELVYEEGHYGSFDLAVYLRRLCAEVGNSYRENQAARIHVRAETLFVSLEQAIPLGIIVQESLENAVTHGGGEREELNVGLEIWESARGTGLVRVSDDGPGLPDGFDPARAESLGYILINQLVRQISGSLRLEEGPGARLLIEFPL